MGTVTLHPAAPVPAPTVSEATYIRASRFLPWRIAPMLRGCEVVPHWIGDSDRFWFWRSTPHGNEAVVVDPATGTGETTPLFDHVQLAAALSRETGRPFAAASLPLTDLELADDGATLRFTLDDTGWTADLANYAVSRGEAVTPPDPQANRSPDGGHEVIVREHNLWLRAVATGRERQLTTDGTADNAYGAPLPSPLADAGLAEPATPVALWSADGSRFLSCRIDQRKAQYLHLVQSLPPDGSTRPRLHRYAYPLPGDETTPLQTVWSFDVASGAGVPTSVPPLPVLYHGQPLSSAWVWWTADAATVFLLTRDRGFTAYRLWRIDAASGAARELIVETGEHGIDPYLAWGAVLATVSDDGTQVLWPAQRDGWGHLYLYDGETGAEVRRLTSGELNVGRVLRLDAGGGWVHFTAVGAEPDVNPYYQLLYRAPLTGGAPERLTPANADHAICFAPSGAFFLATYSTFEQPPVTELRRADGTLVGELARGEISGLTAMGWRPPERFTAKSRDGVTDVSGLMLRPTTFDPAQSYPVVEYIYAGPQVNVVPTTFAQMTAFGEGDRPNRGYAFWQAQAIAELGFVVVMIDGLGMPGRGKAFHDVTYRNLGDGGIPDHIVALRQLADRYPYLDLSRVGIYGHSAGGYASAHAILAHPDFYKVAVSSAGNHDHRLDKAGWVERYMGLPVGAHYIEQANQTLAGQLRGKLFLVHGEMDENVHPASTLVLVDALNKANKDFDLLIVPNRPHRLDDVGYFVRRRWDYFVQHLRGETPPANFLVENERDPPPVLPANHNRDPRPAITLR